MDWELYSKFLWVTLIVLALPGPSFLYVMAISKTKKASQVFANILGLAAGGLLLSTLISVGLSKLLLQIPFLIDVLKWSGGLYLIYLGTRTILKKNKLVTVEEMDRTPAAAFIQGLMVEALNPKSLLFYIALLPQFINPQKTLIEIQLFVLGLTFVSMQLICDLLLVILCRVVLLSVKGFEKNWVFSSLSKWFSGSVFGFLGLYLILSKA